MKAMGGRTPIVYFVVVGSLVIVPFVVVFVVVRVSVVGVVVAVGTPMGRWLGALVFHAAPDHP